MEQCCEMKGVTPIRTGFIELKKCDKMRNRLLIGIDQGCSLTKVVFLNKIHEHQFLDDASSVVTFQFMLFENDDFEEGIKSVKDLAYIPEQCESSVHITGVGMFSRGDFLKSIFGRNIEMIPEGLSLISGLIIGFTDIGIEKVTMSVIVPLTETQIAKNPFSKFCSSQNAKLKEARKSNSDSPFPCLFLTYGSGSAFAYIDADGNSETIGMFSNGGKSLLGLAKCLLDTNNYKELTELAHQGRQENIDTYLTDVLGAYSSKYLESYDDLHLFSFGKLDDLTSQLVDYSRADIARSLIFFNCLETWLNCSRMAIIKNLSKVYLNGNLFQSPIFAEELQKAASAFPLELELIILDYGYAGSLAAMLCDAVDQSKYIH